MATFLEIGLLENFSVIFTFLLMFAITYGVLEKINVFGSEKRGIHAIISLAISFILIMSKTVVGMVNFMAPWFVVLGLFLFFIIFAIRMFGLTENDTIAIIKDGRVYPYIVIAAIIILIGGFSSVFGQSLLEQGTNFEDGDYEEGDIILPGDIEGGSTKTTSFKTNVLNTIVHPKVLGFIAIMVIGMFTITFMTKLGDKT